MAAKKIWSVYEVGSTYKGPLTEVEASSEKAALDSASSFYGVPRRKLYAVPGQAKHAHATMKHEETKEKLQQAAKWIRRELNNRADGSHPSHLASKVLEEADEKFNLGSFGVEGWAKSPSRGYAYLNYGSPHDSTIVIRSNPTQATVIVAMGGWEPYA